MKAHYSCLLGLALLPGLATQTAFGQGKFRGKSVPVLEVEEENEQGSARYPHQTPPNLLTTPGMISPNGPYTSFQINVNAQGQNIVGDAANEPSMTVDPTNPNRMAVGWRQFDSITSDFRQAGNAYTTDGGLTWHNNTVLTPGTFRSDPVLNSRYDGLLFYNSLQQTFYDDIFRSSNFGISYGTPSFGTGGDKQWMVCDNTTSTGRGFLYQAWSTAGNNYSGRQFSRSTDGGVTWMNPINVPQQPVWGTLDIGTNGEVYIAGTNANMANFGFVRSSNAKNSAVTPTFDLARTVDLGGEISYGQAINPSGLSGQTYVAVDRGTGPTRGNIYILCSVDRTPTVAGNPCDVMFARSTNGGSSWSTAVRVNDDALNGDKYHWFGTMSVAPNGRIDVIWNDTRESSDNSRSRLMWSYSLDGGLTWSANTPVSASFNQSLGYPVQTKMGDYISMTSDNTGASVVYTATFNGEEDLYYLRIPAPGIRFSGHATLPDYVGPTTNIPVTVEILAAGTGTVIESGTTNLDANSNWVYTSSSNLQPGTYSIAVKPSHWLRRTFLNRTVALTGTTGLNQTYLNGDADHDNTVSVFDYGLLSDAFDSSPGSSNWNPEADFDGDQTVSVFDYGILSNNFDLTGE